MAGKTAVGGSEASSGISATSASDRVGVHARLAQRAGDPVAGAQRHLALGRQPAGQHQDVTERRRAAAEFVAGGHAVPWAGQVPNVARSSISASTTPASRRTPSLILAGSG